MEKNCGDTIEMDEALEEMSLSRLMTYVGLYSQCDCKACRAALETVVGELKDRGYDTPEKLEELRKRLKKEEDEW